MNDTIDAEFAPEPDEIKPLPELTKEEKAAWVANQDNDAVKAACADSYYFDGDKYWHKTADEFWVPSKQENFAADLRERYSIIKPDAVARILYKIRNERRVDGCFPFLHRKEEVVMDTTFGKALNISRKKCIEPSDVDGPFPTIKAWTDNAFDPKEPKQYHIFMTWWKRLYESCLAGKLKSGQALVVAGGPGIGKTVFMRSCLAQSVGGFSDAGSFLLGKTDFNKEAAENTIWNVDDNRGASTWEKHEEFSNALKRFVANTQIPYHPKFKDSTTVTWMGRIILTCNLDKQSLSILPEIDSSNQDKIIMLMCGKWAPKQRPLDEVEEIYLAELPFFLRWLVNEYESPEGVVGSARFGIIPYQHPKLLDECLSESSHMQLAEMLPIGIAENLVNDTKDKERWMTATQIRQMLDTDGLRSQLNKYGGNRLGIALAKLGAPRIKDAKNVEGYKKYLLNLELE